MTAKNMMAIGAILAGLAVAAGAFGAHTLKNTISTSRLDTFEVAVRYQMYHALALLAIGWITHRWRSKLFLTAGSFMIWGVVLFSGSLYGLVLFDNSVLGMITPAGGILLIIAWALTAYAIIKHEKRP